MTILYMATHFATKQQLCQLCASDWKLEYWSIGVLERTPRWWINILFNSWVDRNVGNIPFRVCNVFECRLNSLRKFPFVSFIPCYFVRHPSSAIQFEAIDWKRTFTYIDMDGLIYRRTHPNIMMQLNSKPIETKKKRKTNLLRLQTGALVCVVQSARNCGLIVAKGKFKWFADGKFCDNFPAIVVDLYTIILHAPPSSQW